VLAWGRSRSAMRRVTPVADGELQQSADQSSECKCERSVEQGAVNGVVRLLLEDDNSTQVPSSDSDSPNDALSEDSPGKDSPPYSPSMDLPLWLPLAAALEQVPELPAKAPPQQGRWHHRRRAHSARRAASGSPRRSRALELGASADAVAGDSRKHLPLAAALEWVTRPPVDAPLRERSGHHRRQACSTKRDASGVPAPRKACILQFGVDAAKIKGELQKLLQDECSTHVCGIDNDSLNMDWNKDGTLENAQLLAPGLQRVSSSPRRREHDRRRKPASGAKTAAAVAVDAAAAAPCAGSHGSLEGCFLEPGTAVEIEATTTDAQQQQLGTPGAAWVAATVLVADHGGAAYKVRMHGGEVRWVRAEEVRSVQMHA